MKAYKIISEDKGKIKKELVVSDVMEARGIFNRSFGLIIKRKLKDRQALLIKKCKSVHTIGMRYRIDVIFLDKDNRVCAIYCNLRPFRITLFVRDAFSVLEVKAGLIEKTTLKVTDALIFS
ncbi:MAG: DUF192 domain-containing protein [Actinomycetota bacterium]|nr:DUF192 domain-containing protein [Actinomycetota bacterium]